VSRKRVPFTGDACVKHNTSMTESDTQGLPPPEAPPPEGTLVFEQPLNERMRTFLRLDFLYSQALYHNEMGSQWGSRAAMGSLIDILAISTRGDVRSDVLKELERQLALLTDFQAKPGVDVERLKTLMTNLVRLRTDLQTAGLTFLQPLRDSEFLSAIKHRSAIPGGTCEFDLPDYYFWLTQPDETRTRTFNEWLGLLRPLCDAVAELLWLTRQNGRARKELAQGGTFNITFDRDNPLQLLRISLPAAAGLYPEISGSHYRCNVRFLAWKGLATRSSQTDADVPFILSCCT
jgi:cell division protein ZapD